MKIKTIFKTTFLSSLLFLGFLVSCSDQESEYFLEDLELLYESDDLLIEAIANATNKQSIDLSALPTDATSTLETSYATLMARQTFEAPSLGFEVNMVGLEPTNLGDNENAYFDKNGRELIPGYDKRDPRNEGDYEGGRQGGKRRIHFELVYPVSFTMPDGSMITVDSKQDFREQAKNWYEANPETEGKPSLVFPVEVIVDEEIIPINSEEEMKALKERLREESRERPYEFVFPISFIMPDGTTLTANSEEELKELIKTWYDANPDTKERPELVYPVDLMLADGEIITINSEEEMREFKRSIREGHGHGHGHRPFEFVFPVSFTMPDGSTITASSEEELDELIGAWYEANPDSEEEPELVFPVDLELKDGEIITINSQEEMEEFLEELRESHGNGGHGHSPFEFVFPISFTMPDGTTLTANSEEELYRLIEAWYEENPESEGEPELVYPVDLELKDGEIITINSEEEMEEFLKELDEHHDGD